MVSKNSVLSKYSIALMSLLLLVGCSFSHDEFSYTIKNLSLKESRGSGADVRLYVEFHSNKRMSHRLKEAVITLYDDNKNRLCTVYAYDTKIDVGRGISEAQFDVEMTLPGGAAGYAKLEDMFLNHRDKISYEGHMKIKKFLFCKRLNF